MARCSNCGKIGLFLKLQNGLCNDCVSAAYRKAEIKQLEARQEAVAEELNTLYNRLKDQEALYTEIATKAEENGIAKAMEKSHSAVYAAEQELKQLMDQVHIAQKDLALARDNEDKAQKAASAAIRKVEKSRQLLKAIDYAILTYNERGAEDSSSLSNLVADVEEFISPTVNLDLQCLGMKDLRMRYRQNEKCIEEVLKKYEGRYTTKTNSAIYKLMVIALKAELQNILYSINYGKLDDALSSVTKITQKYYTIATDGNQNIAPTLKNL